MSVNINIVGTYDDKSIRQAQQDLENLRTKADTEAGRISQAFSGANEAVTAFGKKALLGFAAAGIGGYKIGRGLIDAAEQAETSNARIEQIADSMGLFGDEVDEVTDRLVKLAEAQARATGVDQNAIKATQAKLLTFGELAASADELGGNFDRATMAAVDLAAAGFGDAESNAAQLGRALQDPVKGLTSLTRAGVTFTDAQRDMIAALVESGDMAAAQDVILGALETQVGGTAEATANASDKMRVAWSQLQEKLGEKLLPVFERFTSFLVDKVFPTVERLAKAGFRELGRWVDAVRRPVERVAAVLRDRLAPVLDRIGQWIRDNQDVVRVFFGVVIGVIVVTAIWALAKAMMALLSPVLIVIVAIAALAAAIYYAYTRWDWFRTAVDAVAEALGALVEFIDDKVLPVLKEGFEEAVEFVMPLIRAVETVFSEVMGAVRWAIDNILAPAMRTMQRVVKFAVRIIGPIVGALVTIFEGAMTGIHWVIDNILAPALDLIVALTQKVYNVVEPIVNGIKWLFESIPAAITWAFGKALAAMRTAYNVMRWAWNNTVAKIPSASVRIPGLGRIGTPSFEELPEFPFYKGGLVPGAQTQPVPAMLHGGEYVLSADVVDAIRRGGPSRGLSGASAGPGGAPIHLHLHMDSREVGRAVVDASHRAGGLPIRLRPVT